MPYEIEATSVTPALIIYLIDVSASMRTPMGNKRRIDVVAEALKAVFDQMVFRSTKGGSVRPRYRVAMYTYSDKVYDVYNGIKTIDEIVQMGLPELTTLRTTETAKAFRQAERLLKRELPKMENSPAPLVCHLTDGEYTGADPEPIVRRIMRMRNPDGHVLVENIFISDRLLTEPIGDVYRWPGVRANTPIRNKYAAKLRAMSSPVPESYRIMMLEMGYNIAEDALLFFPGTSPELVEMAFQMSGATKVGP
ncbi:MAG TPA: VWA domain-containing protein [Anaerolineales bacterium]|nr:VWA domain-containing protein [Anaerolineae bacterium]HIP87070.1 VWA domain-containing protein [Anaerolineales bacterium]